MPRKRTKPQTRRSPRNAGRSDYNAPLTFEQEATIWVLAEEGKSVRAIAEELQRVVFPSKVSRVLSKDPVQLEKLRARLRAWAREGWG